MRAPEADAALVPFMERVRGLQLSRAALAAAAVAGAVLSPGTEAMSVRVLGVVAALYLLLTAPTLLVPRMRRSRAISLSGVALLLDGVFLAVATYGTTGYASPLMALLLLHVVAVTLLGSFRTGMKVVVWHTLLMASTYQLQEAGLLTSEVGHRREDVVLVIGALWLVTLATASFAAVNEREIRRRNYDLVALTRLSLRLESSLRPADVGRALLSAVCDDQGVQRAVLLGIVGGRLERLVGQGDTVTQPGLEPTGDVMVHRAVTEHRTLRVPLLDPARDPWLAAALPGARNVILVPVYADGAVAGLLAAEHASARGSRVEARVLGMLEHYASHAALALTNARLLAQMRQLAETDGLTGVANRRTFDRVLQDELVGADGQPRAVTLVLVDLDHFKQLNDTFGHQEGDAVLREAAQALRSASRPVDLVARYGGEEFAVVLPGADEATAGALAERLRATVRRVTAGGGATRVTASFGVAVCRDGGATPEALIATADAALYHSKETGRDRVTVRVVGRGADAAAAPPVPATEPVGSTAAVGGPVVPPPTAIGTTPVGVGVGVVPAPAVSPETARPEDAAVGR